MLNTDHHVNSIFEEEMMALGHQFLQEMEAEDSAQEAHVPDSLDFFTHEGVETLSGAQEEFRREQI
jgi:hypothetical protein